MLSMGWKPEGWRGKSSNPRSAGVPPRNFFIPGRNLSLWTPIAKNSPFPLTPALSLRERENRIPVLWNDHGLGCCRRTGCDSPSP